MTITQIKDLCLTGGGVLLVLMTLIQVVPVKINPWTFIARCIGRAINGEVMEQVNALVEEFKAFKKTDEEEWTTLSRSHILRFGDELLHGTKHSKEHFDQILIDITKYEKYCTNHPEYKNDIATATIKQIRKAYNECLEKHDFL